MAGVWSKLTTTNMDIAKAEFQAKMGKDTGLLKLGPSSNAHSGRVVTEERLLRILPELEKILRALVGLPR